MEPVEKLAENLYRIRVGSPAPFVATNVYVTIRNESPILVDCGLNSDLSYSQLRNGLKQLKVNLAQTQAIFLTHGHLDHAGLASRVSQESGCGVFAHREEFDMIGSWSDHIRKRIGLLLEDWRRMGITEEVFASVQHYLTTVLKYDFSLRAESVTYDTAEEYGLKLVEMPGHTRGSVGFEPIEHPGLLISGDTVLDTLTSLLTNFEDFLSTLDKLDSSNKIELLLPGHGEPLSPVKKWVRSAKAKYLGRVETTLSLINEPSTLYSVSRGIYAKNFEDPNEFGMKLTLILQQTQVFLDYLVKKGRARRFTVGDQVLFQAKSNE